MVLITAVRMTGGEGHEHISSVQWRNPETGDEGTSTRQAMVDWISGGGKALVTDGAAVVSVGVVNAVPPYIRTHADGVWTDNLLALPRF